MSGLFVVYFYKGVTQLYKAVIFARTATGAVSKASRAFASHEKRAEVDVISIKSKEYPDRFHKRRFVCDGEFISPWIDNEENTNDI